MVRTGSQGSGSFSGTALVFVDGGLRCACIPKFGPCVAEATDQNQRRHEVGAQHKELRRSRLSFMHWPIEWLWIAVIVSVALLIFVGLFFGAGAALSENSGVPAPTKAEATIGETAWR